MAIYKIIGADSKQYGPATAEQLREWIAQGRANAQTRTLAEGATEWKSLGAIPEFAIFFVTQIPPIISPFAFGAARKNNSFAIAGMIFGVISWVICCCYSLPWSILGIVFSAVALSQIARHPEAYEGRGLAIAGMVLSITSLIFYSALLAIAVASGGIHYNWNFDQFGQ